MSQLQHDNIRHTAHSRPIFVCYLNCPQTVLVVSRMMYHILSNTQEHHQHTYYTKAKTLIFAPSSCPNSKHIQRPTFAYCIPCAPTVPTQSKSQHVQWPSTAAPPTSTAGSTAHTHQSCSCTCTTITRNGPLNSSAELQKKLL